MVGNWKLNRYNGKINNIFGGKSMPWDSWSARPQGYAIEGGRLLPCFLLETSTLPSCTGTWDHCGRPAFAARRRRAERRGRRRWKCSSEARMPPWGRGCLRAESPPYSEPRILKHGSCEEEIKCLLCIDRAAPSGSLTNTSRAVLLVRAAARSRSPPR